jgi:Ni,Fe-hydrogenase I large subunit
MGRIAIDPITRIGGHLRVEVDVVNGTVRDAWSSGTMFRGMESILRGRDPRDAWLLAQRVCGSCTGVHALASVRAVENALGLTIPRNARLIRNLLAGTQLVQDHVLTFYLQQVLDWVDVTAALRAAPAATAALAASISDQPASSATSFRDVQRRLETLVASRQLGPFTDGDWGHPANTATPEASLLVMAHYLEALDWQRRFMRIHTLLGGKSPHPQTFLVGGMALAPPWGGPNRALRGEHPQQVERNAPIALGERGLAVIADLVDEAQTFVDTVFVPDVLLLAKEYPAWTTLGAGIGSYMAFGEFPEDDSRAPELMLPRGRVGRELRLVEPIDQADVAETVAHSHYAYDAGDQAFLHPWDGQTTQRYGGPTPPVTTLDGADKYSWLKAPRYEDKPMEVGPLARILVANVEGRGTVQNAVQRVVGTAGLQPGSLFSTMGRLLARAAEAQVVVARLAGWQKDLAANLQTGDVAVTDVTAWDPSTWPSSARGWSLGESPRGAVGHWVTIEDRRISEYQIIDATTWNGSPRDAGGRRGAVEEALVGTPVADPARPLEVLRTVRSFAPCTACAVHAHRPGSTGPVEVVVAGRGSR